MEGRLDMVTGAGTRVGCLGKTWLDFGGGGEGEGRGSGGGVGK